MADVLAVRDEHRAQNWAMVVQECSNSGLSKREFCRQRGISEKTYCVACGYTDLRLGIDGLAAAVTQQFGGHMNEESLSWRFHLKKVVGIRTQTFRPAP